MQRMREIVKRQRDAGFEMSGALGQAGAENARLRKKVERLQLEIFLRRIARLLHQGTYERYYGGGGASTDDASAGGAFGDDTDADDDDDDDQRGDEYAPFFGRLATHEHDGHIVGRSIVVLLREKLHFLIPAARAVSANGGQGNLPLVGRICRRLGVNVEVHHLSVRVAAHRWGGKEVTLTDPAFSGYENVTRYDYVGSYVEEVGLVPVPPARECHTNQTDGCNEWFGATLALRFSAEFEPPPTNSPADDADEVDDF